MTVQTFIDTRIRPFIGDGYEVVYTSEVDSQPRKYPKEIILDIINEALLICMRRTDLFEKTGYSIIGIGDKSVKPPKDYLGFVSTESFSAGNSTDTGTTYQEIELQPTGDGFRVLSPLTEEDFKQKGYAQSGIAIPQHIIDYLIETEQITAPENPRLMADLLADRVIVEYKYKYQPKVFDYDSELEFGELYLLLRWYTCCTLLYADLSNESADLAHIYWNRFKYIIEKVAADETDYGNVALTRVVRGL